MADDSPHVVFVSQRFPPEKGGNAARIRDLGAHLSDAGWDVTVLAPPPTYPWGTFDRTRQRCRTDTVDNITVHRLWSWQPQRNPPATSHRLAYYILFGIHAALWIIRNIRAFDLLVTTTPPISTGVPGLWAKALGKPLLVDIRDLWIDASISLGYLEAGSGIERVSRVFQQFVLDQADRISVTTSTLGKAIERQYGAQLGKKTLVIPNGVDVSRFSTATTADDAAVTPGRTDADAAHNSSPAALDSSSENGPPIIIYTGNLGSAQALESCIRAMTHLSHETAVLRLVGSGDRKDALQQLAAELGVKDRVEFAGVVPREQVPELLAAATIGLAPLQPTPELTYAIPTKLYEYAASGLPALTTGRGEIERFIEESGGGVHVQAEPSLIAAQLDALLADSQLRRQLAAGGHEYVASTYDRQTIALRLSDEMNQLLAAADSA
jgi:glycosyltransferase involved in cell wall biosynthesis